MNHFVLCPFAPFTPQIVLCLGFGMLVGCGGEALVPVSGKVCYADGTLVTHGVIEFSAKGDGMSARSAIKENGTFELKTGTRSGVAVGTYRVAIVQVASAEDVPPKFHGHAKVRAVPSKYRRPESSGLEFTIQDRGTNDLTVRLE